MIVVRWWWWRRPLGVVPKLPPLMPWLLVGIANRVSDGSKGFRTPAPEDVHVVCFKAT